MINNAKNLIEKVSQQVSNSLLIYDNELIKVMIPKNQNYDSELIKQICKRLSKKNILIASESYSNNLECNYSIINFIELFEKKIMINGNIIYNKFDLIIVHDIPYGEHDIYTKIEEKEKTPTLTHRINYLNRLYSLPIISISKTYADSELRINHFSKI